MSADWKMIREVFEQALDLEPRDRAAFLDEACADDPDLRRKIEAMLDVAERPGIAATEILDPQGARAASAAARPLRIGMVVDEKYRIDATIGAGGMGAVYRATHLQLERPVALKAIRRDLLANPVMAERFRREAVAVARLRHPHIVTVYDYGVAPASGAYLVMELLEGHSLRAEIARQKRLDVHTALGLMAQVCAAVGAAHRAGVVHRDLKPENVFLERRDGAVTVKVVDFGLAKLETVYATLTHEGVVIGTPGYLSPEQCRGEDADARSDVYALGCVMFEMLTGERPFNGKGAWALVYQHVNDEPPRPSALVPGLAPHVEEAILRALAKSPDARHQTAEAFAEALGAPIVAATPPGGITTLSESFEGVSARTPPTNVPHAVTQFVGREREIADVRRWLEKARLVTLVGPGGIGKTRLAVETASRVLDQYEDGVWLVELASLADPSLVPHAVAAALGVRDHGGRAEAVEGWLRDKRALLVLDNCEHLVEACAGLAARLLVACQGLRVLATSRESLAVAGEAVWPVPALALPARDAEGGLESEAARLFADRASLAKADFEVTGAVAELVRRLEGIPLAIELAAARVKALTVEQILERLDDRFRLLAGGTRTAPSRQQTLQAAIDWSYDLLTDDERALLRRLSVFVGGSTLEAAEAVSAGDGDVLDALTRLVDKSLVTAYERRGAVRYGMLEMVREYAADLLARSGDAEAARRRHADYFRALAEESRRGIRAGQSAEWLERMEEEHDNVRAAFAWLLEHDPDGCLSLVSALASFRGLRGHLAESRRSLEAALARSQTAPASLRASALYSVANVAMIQGDLAASHGFFEKGLALAKEAGDTRQVASITYGLGALANMEGDLHAARAHLEESLAVSRQMGYADVVWVSLNSLGEVARLEGEWSAARALYEQAIDLARRDKHEDFLIVALCNLGAAACEGGDVETARACYEEALATARALGSKEFIGLSLDGLAAVAARRGEWARAGRLAGAAAALLEAIGAALAPVDRAFRERYLREVREHVGDAALEAALAEGRALTPDRAIDDARSV